MGMAVFQKLDLVPYAMKCKSITLARCCVAVDRFRLQLRLPYGFCDCHLVLAQLIAKEKRLQEPAVGLNYCRSLLLRVRVVQETSKALQGNIATISIFGMLRDR